MLKLIASDVDGTILRNGEERISEEFYHRIEELHHQGILFVAASGRPYSYLKYMFEPVSDKMAFIASDGALMIYKERLLGSFPIHRDLGFQTMLRIYKETDCEVVLYGAYMTYTIPKKMEFLDYLRGTVRNHLTVVDCMKKIPEDYLKIGIYHPTNVNEAMKSLGTIVTREKASCDEGGYNLVYDSRNWMEYTAKDVHKGKGIEVLQRRFGILKEESMAFGDGSNDIEMLKQVGLSYAMEDACDELKAEASYITKDVLATMKSVII